MKFNCLATAAAVFASVSAARAADLDKPDTTAAENIKVNVCGGFGVGYFTIPGTDTCMRIGGYLYGGFQTGDSNVLVPRTATYRGASSGAAVFGSGTNGSPVYGGNIVAGPHSSNTVNSYARADFQVDTRTNTEWGLLRSYVDFHTDISASASNSAVTSVRMDYAYLQFGGLTAGRALSFYDFLSPNILRQFDGLVAPYGPTDLIGYTLGLGNGLSASLAVEDPTTTGYADSSTVNPSTNYSGRRPGATFSYGGLQVPDFTTKLNLTQPWGSAQVSAGLHQDYGSAATPVSKFGYGVLGGVRYLAPSLGEGDFVQLQAAYSVGAIEFVDWANAYELNEKSNASGASNQYTDLGADATYSAATGIRQTKAWSVYTTVTHFFSPKFELDASVGYLYENGYSQVPGLKGYGNSTFGDVEAEIQLQWKPVKQFQIIPYIEARSVAFNSRTAKAYNFSTNTANMANFGLRAAYQF